MPLHIADLNAINEADEQAQEAALLENQVIIEELRRKLSAIDYDVPAAVEAGVDFEEKPEGGIDLPNKFSPNLTVNGRDIQSGETLTSRNDPDGMGAMGYDRYRESTTNTVTGPNADIYDALVPLEIERRQNGEDGVGVPVPPDMAAQAKGAVDALGQIRAIEAKLQEVEATGDAGEPVEEELPTMSQEELAATPEFTNAATQVAQWFADTTGGDVPTDNAELVELAIEEMSGLYNSTWKMSEAIYAVESGDMPPEVQQAYSVMLQYYDRVSAFDWDVWQSGAVNILTDPATYALGGLGVKLAQKTAAMNLFKSRLTQAMAGGAAAGSMEGAAFAGLGDAADQEMRKGEIDLGQSMIMGGFGALAGGVFGAGIATALSEPGRQGIMNFYRQVSNNWAAMSTPMPGSPAAQRGSFSMRPIADIHRALKVQQDRGIEMADSIWTDGGSSAWYSRLGRNLLGANGRWAQAFGTKKSVPAVKVQEMLQKWLETPPKDGEGFSLAEVKDTALDQFLEARAAAGESITLDELDDWLWANRPRVNVAISTPDDKQGFVKDANIRLYEHLADRLYRAEPAAPGPTIQMATYANQATNSYLAAVDQYMQRLHNYRMTAFTGETPLAQPRFPKVGSHFSKAGLDESLGRYAKELEGWALERVAHAEDMGVLVDGLPMMEASRPEYVAMATPRWKLIDRASGEQITPQGTPDGMFGSKHMAESFAKSRARQAVIKEPASRVAALIDKLDIDELKAGTHWGTSNNYAGQPLLIGGKEGGSNANNYREMRLYVPFAGNTPDQVAQKRFGKPLELLGKKEQDRSHRIASFMKQEPVDSVTHPLHHPGEPHVLAHIRLQDMYAPDGTKVLAVAELQSDLATRELNGNLLQTHGGAGYKGRVQPADAFNQFEEMLEDLAVEDIDDNVLQFLREQIMGIREVNDINFSTAMDLVDEINARVPDLPKGDLKKLQKAAAKYQATIAPEGTEQGAGVSPTDGWQMMAMNRLLQYATDNGYTAVALPIDIKMVQRIEAWGDRVLPTFDTYDKILPALISKDKKFLKRWNLKYHKKGMPVMSAPDGSGTTYEKMAILEITKPADPDASKAIYGIGAVAAPGGAMMLGQEESDNGIR